MKFTIVLVPIAIALSVFLLAPQAAPVVFAQPAGWVELVDERTRTGKVFFDPSRPGVIAVDVSVAKVHYDGPDWKDIDNSLVPSLANVPTIGLVDLEMVTDDYEFYALQTLNTIPLWLYRNKSAPDIYVTFNPQGVGWTNDLDDVDLISMPQSVIGTVTDNRIRWEDAYGPGINLTLSAQAGRLAKFLTLEAMPRPPAQYIIDGGNPALELQFIFGTPSGPNAPDIRVDGALWDQSSRTETVNAVEFQVGGETIFSFAEPTAFDSGFGITNPSFVFTKQGPNLRVAIRVPLAFLQDAVYPVVIDPTVDEQVGAGVDDGYCSNESTFFGAAVYLTIGHSGANWYDSFARWTSVNVPNGVPITSAYIRVVAQAFGADGAGTDTNIYLEDADDAVAPTTCVEMTADIRTSNFTPWNDYDFTDDTTIVDSPSMVSVVGEVINRSLWASGNDMMLLWDADGPDSPYYYRPFAYDGDPSKAIRLHIEYTLWTNTAPSISNKITADTTALDEDYARSFSATDPDTNQTLQWELNTTDAPFTITVWNGGNRTTWVNATPDTLGTFYVNVTVGDDALGPSGNETDYVNFTLNVIEAAAELTDVEWVEVIFISIMFFFLTALGFAVKYAWPLLFVAGLIGVLEGIWLISLTQFGFIGLTFIAPGIVVIVLGAFKLYGEVS